MKSKIAKKVIAASLATVMAVGMIGCGSEDAGNNNASSSTPTSQTPDSSKDVEPEATPEPEVSPYTVITDADGNPINLGGMEIVMRDWWSTGEVAEPNNAFEEAQQEYRAWAQETYNFTFKEQAISDWGSTPQDFVDYATSGGDENYIFVLRQGGEFVSAMNSGLMYDLSTLDCLDFSEEKWQTNKLHEVASGKNGEIYAMRAIEPEPRGGIYFNKRLLEEAGINPNDVYTWVSNGEWTWEKFEEVCSTVQKDNDNDGVIDVYAMVQQGSQFHSEAVASNKGHFVDKVDGQYTFGLDSQATLDALNWSVDMRAQYEMPQPEGSNWDYFLAEYRNGKAVFFADQAYRANQDLKEMEDDFGFVPFPKGPNADSYYSWYEDNPMVIPACYDAEKAWKIAFAYDVWTAPIPGFEDTENWKTAYYSQFRDMESVDIGISNIVGQGGVTYHSFVAGINLGEDILWNLGTANSSEDGTIATPAQEAEKLKNAWQAHIDAANGN